MIPCNSAHIKVKIACIWTATLSMADGSSLQATLEILDPGTTLMLR